MLHLQPQMAMYNLTNLQIDLQSAAQQPRTVAVTHWDPE